MRRLIATLLCGIAVTAGCAFAQGTLRAFDVISIKPNDSGGTGSGENTEHGRLTVMNDTAKQASSHTNTKDGRATTTVQKDTPAMLASRLEWYVGRKVIDHTGLTAAYDFTLTWSQDQSADPAGPSIFTALQEQPGLKLDSTKGSVDLVVIDAVERPTEN